MKIIIASLLASLAVFQAESHLRAAADEEKTPFWCASLSIHKDAHCKSSPVQVITFPTFSEPGSPCYFDENSPVVSVKDQYCNPETGNWHQDVYFWSKSCQVPWWAHKFSPMMETLTTDGCQGRVKLQYCKEGNCVKDDPNFMSWEEAHAIIQAHSETTRPIAPKEAFASGAEK